MSFFLAKFEKNPNRVFQVIKQFLNTFLTFLSFAESPTGFSITANFVFFPVLPLLAYCLEYYAPYFERQQISRSLSVVFTLRFHFKSNK